MTTDTFHCDVEKSPNDEFGNQVTMIKCHGRLVSDTSERLKEVVKIQMPQGGRIIVDLADVNYLDSSGLGSLVGIKASAVKQGLCILEFANITPRVLELLRITNLLKMFSS